MGVVKQASSWYVILLILCRYNENQYSLPRWEDLSVSRQTMYDNTYHFIPTQGWMFLPLVVYHGGKRSVDTNDDTLNKG